jgi:hypothetical protein
LEAIMSDGALETSGDQPKTGEMRDIAVLDLTGMKSEEELAGITSIRDCALVLVPESLSGKLMTIPMSDVACIVPVPQGARVKMMTGQINLAGEALANDGGTDDILVCTGQICITSPVQKVGYQLHITGQFFAPKGSEAAIGAATVRLMGQTIYYTGTPRFYNGENSFTKEFLEFLDGKITLILNGGFRVEPGVTPDLLKAKIGEIVLNGELKAPRELIPALMALTVELNGQIAPLDDASPDPSAKIISNG